MVVENAVHTRQSSIYTTRHSFNTAGCIHRFIERTSFTISRSFIVVTVALHWSPVLLRDYSYIRLGAAPCGPDTRVPASGPGQLGAQVIVAPAANQRPVLPCTDQSEGRE